MNGQVSIGRIVHYSPEKVRQGYNGPYVATGVPDVVPAIITAVGSEMRVKLTVFWPDADPVAHCSATEFSPEPKPGCWSWPAPAKPEAFPGCACQDCQVIRAKGLEWAASAATPHDTSGNSYDEKTTEQLAKDVLAAAAMSGMGGPVDELAAAVARRLRSLVQAVCLPERAAQVQVSPTIDDYGPARWLTVNVNSEALSEAVQTAPTGVIDYYVSTGGAPYIKSCPVTMKPCVLDNSGTCVDIEKHTEYLIKRTSHLAPK